MVEKPMSVPRNGTDIKIRKYIISLVCLMLFFSNFLILASHQNSHFKNNYSVSTAQSDIPKTIPLWQYPLECYSFELSSNGNYFAAVGEKKLYLFFNSRQDSGLLWDAESHYKDQPPGCHFYKACISSNGTYIAALDGWPIYSHLTIFNKVTSTPLWRNETVFCGTGLDISSDGDYIVTEGGGKEFCLFNGTSSNLIWVKDTQHYTDEVKISADGNYIVGHTYNNSLWRGFMYLFHKSSSNPLWIYNYTIGFGGPISNLDISENGDYIILNQEKNISLHHRSSPNPLWTFTNGSDIQDSKISSDGNYIVMTDDKSLYLFHRSSPVPLWNYTLGFYKVAISSNGSYITGTSSNPRGYVYFFNKESSNPLWWVLPGGSLDYISISSDGEYVALGGENIYLFSKDLNLQDEPESGLKIPYSNPYLLILIIGVVSIIMYSKYKIRRDIRVR